MKYKRQVVKKEKVGDAKSLKIVIKDLNKQSSPETEEQCWNEGGHFGSFERTKQSVRKRGVG